MKYITLILLALLINSAHADILTMYAQFDHFAKPSGLYETSESFKDLIVVWDDKLDTATVSAQGNAFTTFVVANAEPSALMFCMTGEVHFMMTIHAKTQMVVISQHRLLPDGMDLVQYYGKLVKIESQKSIDFASR